MAIKICTDCGHKVSSRSRSCTQCGCPTKATSTLDHLVQLVVILTGIYCTYGFYEYSQRPPSAIEVQFQDLDDAAKDGIRQLQSYP